MKQRERQAFLFRIKWLNRFERLTPAQVMLIIKAINAQVQQQDISMHTKKMQEKTLIVWELILEELQEDMQAYEIKCEKLRENASRGGLARIANASKCNQMLANGSKSKQIERDSDSDIEEKSIYKNIYTQKEDSNCLNFAQICELTREKITSSVVADCFVAYLTMRDSLPNNKSVSNEITLDTLIARLRDLAHTEEEAIKVLNNSIRNNLTDLYPLKKESTSKTDEVRYAN